MQTLLQGRYALAVRYDSSSSTDAAQGGYLLLVVPRDMVDILSSLWCKNLTTLGAEGETTLIAIPDAIWLVQRVMLEELEELLKGIEPFIQDLSCAGTSTGSLKSLWLPHCNCWMSL